MADIVSKETRSRMMRGIRSKNTIPELIIRKALYRRGFRYRLHSKDILGKPDLTLRKYNALIFIHGCFWHYHGCSLSKLPPDEIWKNKLLGNKRRDEKTIQALLKEGWRVAIVWECSLRGRGRIELEEIVDELAGWLKSSRTQIEVSGVDIS